MKEIEFSGRVAIVTGGSRGIGAAIAEALCMRGATVVISSRRLEDLETEAARLNAMGGGRVEAVAAHGGRPEDLARLVETVLERHGRIDVLVNNSATNPHFGGTLDAELSAWDKTFEVNLRGVFILTQLVVSSWMEAHGGAIVNVASIGGVRPAHGLGVYNVTKAALIHLTRQLALELGPRGIRVNAVAPGVVRTRFAEALWANDEIHGRVVASNPLGRIGEPDEVAAAVAFLASDAASYVNGEIMLIDGGGGEIH